MTMSSIHKVYQGIADRRQMFRLFDRHAGRPVRFEGDDGVPHCGEWFEIGASSRDDMFEILPPLWIRCDSFALREFLTGSITSIFFTLSVEGCIRHFHGYCDLLEKASPERMRAAILEREGRPFPLMTRLERLDHIWSSTADDDRGYAGSSWPEADQGKPTIMLFDDAGRATSRLLDALTEAEIAAKLPVHLRHLPEHQAA